MGDTVKRLALLLVLLAIQARGQSFQDFIARVQGVPEPQRNAIVDSFMNANPVFPLVENDTLCHYLYRGAASSVTVPGDANGWNASAFPMARVSTTDLWYRSVSFPADSRLDYKFVLNGGTWILDPRNPHQVLGGFGPNSELRMPAYVPPWEIVYNPAVPHGTLRDTVFSSALLGNSRTVRIYTPPFYASGTDSFPVLLVHDGLEYVTLAYANNVLDNLIAQGRIVPVIGVFVPPVNRTAEYAGSQMVPFTDFILTELMPVIDARYRTRRDPASRAVMGASNGGNISLWIGYTHPEAFGKIAAQSSNIISSISSGFQTSPRLDLELYMDLGTYDIASLIPLVRNFIPILQSKGYPYRYEEYNDGHSWGNWRAHIDNALELFYPGPALSAKEHETIPVTLNLEQNYPNLFNLSTSIRYTIPEGSSSQIAILTIHDLLGREVSRLPLGAQIPGTHVVEFNASGLASGFYFYQLELANSRISRRMVLLR